MSPQVARVALRDIQQPIQQELEEVGAELRRIIAAAREHKSILEVPVYDGSEKGEKVYNTTTVIGREIAPDERVPTDAAAGKPELAGLKRWPVTVS